ncbi:hypothetical protein [Cupriavidus oxalaticus]|nr:hypothetical protein [Cupriavidus oxalaticus]
MEPLLCFQQAVAIEAVDCPRQDPGRTRWRTLTVRYIQSFENTRKTDGMAHKSIRVSHVGVPGDLSVLKLKGYLKSALAGVAQSAADDEILLVKVLVPRSLGLQAGEKLLDKILQGIVDRDPRVSRVSVEFVDGEVTPEKIAESQVRTQKEIDAYGHLLQSTDNEQPD